MTIRSMPTLLELAVLLVWLGGAVLFSAVVAPKAPNGMFAVS